MNNLCQLEKLDKIVFENEEQLVGICLSVFTKTTVCNLKEMPDEQEQIFFPQLKRKKINMKQFSLRIIIWSPQAPVSTVLVKYPIILLGDFNAHVENNTKPGWA